jgi:glutamate--cysteine ligase catalytic subunit
MHMNTGVEEFDRLNTYLDFVRKRANGQEPTNAKWIRQFVDQHVDYQHDSIIPQSVCYDLLSHWS